jgi:hypothetical protein
MGKGPFDRESGLKGNSDSPNHRKVAEQSKNIVVLGGGFFLASPGAALKLGLL